VQGSNALLGDDVRLASMMDRAHGAQFLEAQNTGIALFGGQIWVRYAREMPGAFGCPEISSDGD